MATSPVGSELRQFHATTLAHIQRQFGTALSGRSVVTQRTALVDQLSSRLWKQFISEKPDAPSHFALVAIGGYGRGLLFPYSDVDILFLHDGVRSEREVKEQVRRFSQEMWDLKLRLSPQNRTISECDALNPNNPEFTISLLDARYLAGDRELFHRLQHSVIPRLVIREGRTIVEQLAEVTKTRHAKFGNTIFHLEPNIKEAPGGLRDYNVVHWLTHISAIEKLRDAPNSQALVSPAVRAQFDSALEYLLSVRCFLHFHHGRDDNTLTWETQADAAARHIGISDAATGSTEEWMRIYYRHARSIHRVATQLLEEIPASRSSLYRELQNWRSRISNSNFSVVNGFILLQQPGGVKHPDLLLQMFTFIAQSGLKLATATEQRIEQSLPLIVTRVPKGRDIWKHLRELLTATHAADALRAMHHLQLLNLFLPEVQVIDSLVIRDFYHRFTVDEHSFLAIQNLHRLEHPQSEWERLYGEILSELEQPELLYLALLLHDVGKGMPGDDHVQSSLEAAQKCLARLGLSSEERDTVLFLIGSHLEMSAALRRDIFDHQTVENFADSVNTPERLKMLCLLTYADIKSVNLEALTPWKTENIWQLYIATSNHMSHSVDRERVHVEDAHDDRIAHVCVAAPNPGELKTFLEGLPQRYLRSHASDAVIGHLKMARALDKDPVQLDLKRGRHWFELTVVTQDRPALFVKIAGVLSAWGMNIVKAAAVSNSARIVVDVFYFTDRFRTLELNIQEWDRFKQDVRSVLVGETDLDQLLKDKLRVNGNGTPKVDIKTRVSFDRQSSAHCTLIEIVAQDRPGLLHRIASVFAQEQCNIEIALIDTEGQVAIDVFYLTSKGDKLTQAQEEKLERELFSTSALSATHAS
jgi:[protein-PII] uridylyltransferase